MKINLHGQTNSIELSEASFGVPFNEPLIHQVVTAYAAAGRAGTKAQKTRAEVRGGGRKPWRQKGTGRARAGTSRGPLWIGGGRAFAARPRNFEQKVNRKMYRGAVRSMVSELLRQQRLLLVDEVAVSAPKTKELKSKLDAWGFDNVLIVVEAFAVNLWLAARNLPAVSVIEVGELDPMSLLRHDQVVMSAAAAKMLEERLA
jgi:large subunit ribosomal protein L4